MKIFSMSSLVYISCYDNISQFFFNSIRQKRLNGYFNFIRFIFRDSSLKTTFVCKINITKTFTTFCSLKS